jgi:UDP-glucose 4-epimerase
VLNRLERITGTRPGFIEGDVLDREALDAVFADHDISAVVHFAGLKAVGESVAEPLRYYRTNVGGTLTLLEAMSAAGCRALIFSSSATVYGEPPSNPMIEGFPFNPENPYGRSKAMVEEMLRDLQLSDGAWNIGALRYFNPVGAHESGLIGEDPQGVPNNLVPFIAQVAVGRHKALQVFGGDYPTRDGTGVRDYIHVMDLAEGHTAALAYLLDKGGYLPVNLGTGQGVSVLEMVAAFAEASGKEIPHIIVDRRPGDIAQYWADPALAKTVLGWEARRTVADMCADAWRWQSTNPQGYAG